MPKDKGDKRIKTSSTEAMQSSSDSNVIAESHKWLINENDVKFFLVVKSLPTEIQFQIFSILFRTTHSVIEIVDLMDPNWFEENPSNSSHDSPMWYLLRILFQRTVRDSSFGEVNVHNSPPRTKPEFDHNFLLKYFEPDYFKLIIPLNGTDKNELLSRCAELATECCFRFTLTRFRGIFIQSGQTGFITSNNHRFQECGN
ncbi:unnamed protein product [Ambrosiozyma monospora]|uniref:Unnamed protein product n=1 Tax=Ambrosiozyma monospora TaxID=43982 RepID=A0ACB5T108_AMBMO|nr:unnamed protein product [Ambrosiozyma monospora]